MSPVVWFSSTSVDKQRHIRLARTTCDLCFVSIYQSGINVVDVVHPCPYCGCPNVYLAKTFGAGYTVACPECGMSGPESKDGVKEEAWAGWDILCRKMCRKCNVNLLASNRSLRERVKMLEAVLAQQER